MPKTGTGLPLGKPPKGGHPPSVIAAAAAKRRAGITSPRRKPGEPKRQVVATTWDAKAIRKLWDDVYDPKMAPKVHKRPPGVPDDLVRMYSPVVRIGGPGIVIHHLDPGAIYVPNDRVGDMLGHGFKVEH